MDELTEMYEQNQDIEKFESIDPVQSEDRTMPSSSDLELGAKVQQQSPGAPKYSTYSVCLSQENDEIRNFIKSLRKMIN
ncbi:hypothetical protein TNCV_2319911 [Trichonephila clavipes]|nr:hypothetical protein TNCV_2319911 [Trichonephila clavipes]